MEPVPVAHAVQDPTDDHFGPGVPALDRLHDASALLRRAGVHRSNPSAS